jgi:hypothetical protein
MTHKLEPEKSNGQNTDEIQEKIQGKIQRKSNKKFNELSSIENLFSR